MPVKKQLLERLRTGVCQDTESKEVYRTGESKDTGDVKRRKEWLALGTEQPLWGLERHLRVRAFRRYGALLLLLITVEMTLGASEDGK